MGGGWGWGGWPNFCALLAYDQAVRPFLLSTRFAFDVLGLVIVSAAFYASTLVSGPFPDIIVSVATSLLFVVALDLLIAARSHLLDRRRQRMFGSELVRRGATLVYPDFVMNDDVKHALAETNQQLLYRRPRSRYADRTTHRIDIPRVVAANDIRALLLFSEVFRANARLTQMVVDRDILDSSERSFVSFGLSSNDCTHLYLDLDPEPLFEIVPDGSGSEYLRIPFDSAEFRSTSTRQYGLICRYSPAPKAEPERRWFLVAGLGAVGTTAAARFIAKSWTTALSVLGGVDDFLLIVSTGVGSDEYPRLEAAYVRSPATRECTRVEAWT